MYLNIFFKEWFSVGVNAVLQVPVTGRVFFGFFELELLVVTPPLLRLMITTVS